MSRMRPRAVVREVLLVVLPAAVGYAVAGLTGALVAAAAVIAGRLPSDAPGRAVSMAAFVLLIGAALATVLEADIGGPVSLAFPLQRELAADLGAAAGILLLAAVVASAADERAPEPIWGTPGPAGPAALGADVGWREAAVLLGALLVRVAGAPDLAAGFTPLILLLQDGGGIRVQGEQLLAPLAPAAAAYGPGGARAVQVVVGTAAVGGVLVLARRLAPRGTDPVVGALVAGALAAALPLMWRLALPETLAAAGAVAAVVLAEPRRLTPARAVFAGTAAGLAALARPDALVVAPVLLAWVLVGERRGLRPSRRAVRSAWSLAGGAALVVAPWILWAHGDTGSWFPAETFGPAPVRPEMWLVVLAGLTAAAVAVVAAVAAATTFRASQRALLPLVVLPVWCAAMTVVEGFGHGAPLSWGGPFVTVLAGWQVAVWVADRRAAQPAAGRSAA